MCSVKIQFKFTVNRVQVGSLNNQVEFEFYKIGLIDRRVYRVDIYLSIFFNNIFKYFYVNKNRIWAD